MTTTAFEAELGRAARALEVLAPTGPAALREGFSGEFQVRPRQRVRTFTCNAADLVEVGRIVGRAVTGAELRAAVETAAGTAVRIAGRAAAALEASPRTATTRRLFCEAFGVNPEFVPPWRATLPGRIRWRDLGELVAIRLRSAARIIDGGFIRYFCWHRPTGTGANCTECPQDPRTIFACSSFRGRHVICFGGAFWRAFRAGDRATLASTVLHEALHIFFSTTVSDKGRSGNANCYERFALRFNGLRVHPDTDSACPAGACRTTPPRPRAPRVVDGFAHNSNALTPAHTPRIAAIARDIAAATPLVSRVRLVGHADSTGPAAYNVTLGANRAQVVRQALVRAVDSLRPGLGQRIQWIVESRGETEPADTNATAAGRARNRRVHVYVGG